MTLPFRTPFLFLRHGQTAANAADIIAGSTDLPLTLLGHVQARAAAEQVAALPDALQPRTIWCSPLIRAKDTAAPVAQALRLPMHLMADLRERDWGIWEGEPRHVLQRDETPAGGEGPGEFQARIEGAMARLSGVPPLLIVAHSGVARALHRMIGRGPFRRPQNGELFLWSPDGADGWRCEVMAGHLTEPGGQTDTQGSSSHHAAVAWRD